MRRSSALVQALSGGLRLARPIGNKKAVYATKTRAYEPWGLAGAPRFMSSAAKEEKKPDELSPLVYEDSFIQETLAISRTIAMVGASTSWNRPSFFAMKYLQVCRDCNNLPSISGGLRKTALDDASSGWAS